MKPESRDFPTFHKERDRVIRLRKAFHLDHAQGIPEPLTRRARIQDVIPSQPRARTSRSAGPMVRRTAAWRAPWLPFERPVPVELPSVNREGETLHVLRINRSLPQERSRSPVLSHSES